MSFRALCDSCDKIAQEPLLTLSVEEGLLDAEFDADGVIILHFCGWRCLGKAVASVITPAKTALTNTNVPANDLPPGAIQDELPLEVEEAPARPDIDPNQFLSAFGITRK